MKPLLTALLAAALAGCASQPERALAPGMSTSEVSARIGKPVATGRLPSGEEYWDYSAQPFGYTNERITFGADGRLRAVRNLLTEQNFGNLRAGMTPDKVLFVVGPTAPSEKRDYAGGTKSWTYRYDDIGVHKLLHVIFDSTNRVSWHYTEWDPSVYSRGGSGKDHGGR